MSIQINQLVIKTTVTDDGKGPTPGQPAREQGADKKKQSAQQDLVAECVEQVMEILREQQER